MNELTTLSDPWTLTGNVMQARELAGVAALVVRSILNESQKAKAEDFFLSLQESYDEFHQTDGYRSKTDRDRDFAQWIQSDFAKEHLDDFIRASIENRSRIARIAIGRLFALNLKNKNKKLSSIHAAYLRALIDQDDDVLSTLNLVCEILKERYKPYLDWKTSNSTDRHAVLAFSHELYRPYREKFLKIEIQRVADIKRNMNLLQTKGILHDTEEKCPIDMIFSYIVYPEFENFEGLVNWSCCISNKIERLKIPPATFA